MSFGVYFHIPYCFSRCRYCDFYAAGAARAVPDAYVDALLRALAGFAAALPGPPDTVYLGGGTPSLLTPAHLYVWDEPFNYIDVFSRMQIEKLILEYRPTMLFVEHDARFRENVATKIVNL